MKPEKETLLQWLALVAISAILGLLFAYAA